MALFRKAFSLDLQDDGYWIDLDIFSNYIKSKHKKTDKLKEVRRFSIQEEAKKYKNGMFAIRLEVRKIPSFGCHLPQQWSRCVNS
jgi:hypothetical protein